LGSLCIQIMWYRKRPLVAWFFTGVALVAGLVFARKILVSHNSDVWVAMSLTLPERITPREMSIAGYYVVKQTHEPVFRKEDGFNYTSKLLERWERSLDYRKYYFCPKGGLEFYKGKPFTREMFFSHVRDITAKFNSEAQVRSEDGCVSVSFGKPARKYLDFLCAFANAPSVAISPAVEAGLGSFLVEAIGPGGITLNRRKKVSNGFNRVELVSYRRGEASAVPSTRVSDYNLALSRDELETLGPEYIHFDNLAMKSAVLLIDIPDYERRKFVYNCVDIDALRHAFAPNVKKFNYIQTLLPVGVPGALPGRPAQECSAHRVAGKGLEPLILANWRTDNYVEMSSFADQFYAKTGVRIKVENYPPEKLAVLLHAKEKPFNMVIIMTTPDSDDNYRFLASYFGKNSLLRHEISGIAGLYDALLKSDGGLRQQELASEIAQKISGSCSLLPIYQSVNTVYYPKGIRNLYVGKELFEYPEIAEFRW